MGFCSDVSADLMAACQGRVGFGQLMNMAFFSRGFHTMLLYRVEHALLAVPVVGLLSAKIIWYVSSIFTNCDICYHARIGGGVYMPHALAIVIGDKVTIGKQVTILHGVTVGKSMNGSKQRQVIGDGAYLGAGAKIVGDIEIGEKAVIGANAVVTKSISANAVAVGVPARVVKRG